VRRSITPPESVLVSSMLRSRGRPADVAAVPIDAIDGASPPLLDFFSQGLVLPKDLCSLGAGSRTPRRTGRLLYSEWDPPNAK
jgi:hypothetical protein